eukprot:1522351-Rhodomonas_salina.1
MANEYAMSTHAESILERNSGPVFDFKYNSGAARVWFKSATASKRQNRNMYKLGPGSGIGVCKGCSRALPIQSFRQKSFRNMCGECYAKQTQALKKVRHHQVPYECDAEFM